MQFAFFSVPLLSSKHKKSSEHLLEYSIAEDLKLCVPGAYAVIVC